MSESAHTADSRAWYHADFCHAYAWVYEEGDNLRVRWGERDGSNLVLHRRSECERCRELHLRRAKGRHGEFTMPKPEDEFSSAAAFFVVLAEIAKYVPGLLDEPVPSSADSLVSGESAPGGVGDTAE